jgi:hypothetical protein
MVESVKSLDEVFKSFTAGKNEIANKEFTKLNKDCGLIDKAYTNTDVDLIFTKFKSKTAKVLTYDQFLLCLEDISKKKKVDVSVIKDKIVSSGGPHFIGTKTDYVKFHDDKSTYTGVYAKGGPSTVDGGKGIISDISQTCDRSSADVRGVKK